MNEEMIEKLKTALLTHGAAALQDFLGCTFNPALDEETINSRIDDILDQMPEDIFAVYYKKYVGEESEFQNNYYFTFASDDKYPYQNGWIVITATNEEQARRLFQALYPNTGDNTLLRCAGVYDQKTWETTCMYKNNSNLGYGCHRKISLQLSFE